MLERLEHGSVHELRLARPPVNAFSPELLRELAVQVRRTPELGGAALVISGREGMFSAGLDVPHFLTLDREAVRGAWLDFFDMMRAVAGVGGMGSTFDAMSTACVTKPYTRPGAPLKTAPPEVVSGWNGS